MGWHEYNIRWDSWRQWKPAWNRTSLLLGTSWRVFEDHFKRWLLSRGLAYLQRAKGLCAIAHGSTASEERWKKWSCHRLIVKLPHKPHNLPAGDLCYFITILWFYLDIWLLETFRHLEHLWPGRELQRTFIPTAVSMIKKKKILTTFSPDLVPLASNLKKTFYHFVVDKEIFGM